jgi:repressor LexA
MKNSFKAIDRILQLIEIEGTTMYALEKAMDLGHGYFGKKKRENAGIGEEILRKIIEFYPKISAEWLLTGNGGMLKKEKNRSYSEEARIKEPSESYRSGVPIIPFSAIAGYANGDQTALERECLRCVVEEFKGAEFIIRLQGDSMVPEHKNGDMVACKSIAHRDLIQWGRVYILDTIDGPMCKRIFAGSTDSTFSLVSDNRENYPAFEIDRKHVRKIFSVLGHIRIA